MMGYDIYLFHYYSLVSLFNKLLDLNVEIKKYYVYRGNDYYLKINRKYRKIIKDNFKDYKIVSKLGILGFLENLFLRPITFISLIVSVCLFWNLSNRIYKIDLYGDYPLIEEKIVDFLNTRGLKSFSFINDLETIKSLEVNLKEEFKDELEFVEMIKYCANVSINYKKRRKEIVIEGKKGSLYASKDGVVKGFSLLSGVKNVKEYDYVKKGDLLVSDIIITSNNDNVVIGTLGKVFASTFYYIEVKCDSDIDSASKYAYLLDKARYEVGKNLNSNDEYIESENILVSDINKGYMKIYYVLYEDITI